MFLWYGENDGRMSVDETILMIRKLVYESVSEYYFLFFLFFIIIIIFFLVRFK